MQPFETARRFRFMSNIGNADIRLEHDPMEQKRSVEYVSTTDARQGLSGMGVRYVLAISLSAALAVMAVIYFIYAG